MKRNINVILSSAIMALFAVQALPQAAQQATIEPETKAKIVLQSQLSSKLSEVGDPITAVLYEPIYVNGQLVMPRGTEFRGRVTSVAPAKRGMKGAQMGIIFERFAMPWGEEPAAVMLTAIDDWTANEKLKADDEGKVKGDRNGGKAAENVQRGGQIGAAGAGAVILGGAAAGAGPGVYAAGAGAIGGGLLAGLLLTKGKEVRLQPGAIFRIKFTKPLTLPVIETPGSSPKPILQDPPVSSDSSKKPPQ
ncbi:MAG TPA: hypothetical protein VGV87_11815 [Blastocatellia bacterium]|jgi:hypothetical protein|nr:hypothetical protein [Blastocatellia bacterium]